LKFGRSLLHLRTNRRAGRLLRSSVHVESHPFESWCSTSRTQKYTYGSVIAECSDSAASATAWPAASGTRIFGVRATPRTREGEPSVRGVRTAQKAGSRPVTGDTPHGCQLPGSGSRANRPPCAWSPAAAGHLSV
jgi:hypothetical protein